MKSLIIVLVPLLCLIISPTKTNGGWPKPFEVSNVEKLSSTDQPRFYGKRFNFGESKIWKCVYTNGSGVAISISYPSGPQPPSPKPPTPSSPPPTPKMSPPPPKPSPPRPSPKWSPPPLKPSLPPPKPSPPRPSPKMSPPPPKPSLPPPSPKKSPPPSPPKPSTPPPTQKKSPPPPKPSSPPPKPSPPPPKTSLLIIHSPPTPKMSPPPPNESNPSISPPAEPTTPSTPRHQNPNPWGHFISCISDFGPSAICKQQMEVSYYTRRFGVSEYCCNLIVNMRNECTDVILGFYTDPFFVPLIRCTCHVKN